MQRRFLIYGGSLKIEAISETTKKEEGEKWKGAKMEVLRARQSKTAVENLDSRSLSHQSWTRNVCSLLRKLRTASFRGHYGKFLDVTCV